LKNVKKEKIVMAISVGISCFALVLVMCMQFKVVQETDITSIENMKESELRTELSEWKSKYEEINSKYDEIEEKISEYQNKKESNNETSELLKEELEQVNKSLGKTDVQGEGIIITINNIEDDDLVVKTKAEDLLLIVNQLKNGGAEAISINDERIVNMSDIVSIGAEGDNFFIKINGKRILAPYVIKAIGNQSYLEGEG
jgi:uncharacterized protein YlxW (UPF0749 family)